jgi:hypothetical protein
MIEIVTSLFITAHAGFSDHNLNWVHPHIGVETEKYAAGLYYNSERRVSFYVSRTLYSGPVDIAGGVVTGYASTKVLPFISVSRYLDKGFTVFVIPSVDSETRKPSLVLGLEYKIQ